ncbi:cardiolipin synthase [Cytobacillus sp. Hz8]|uniref:cardiolipin synthase n=1 Tax=Cytobacillus sp. Hz8 TaxID=3347168 RepID=UPI0035D8AF5D
MIFFITFILAIFVIYLWADFHFGRKRHLATFQKRQHPIRNSDITLFTQGGELFEDFFAEIQKAKHHIHILFFIVKKDTVSKRFFEALMEKAQAGVEVKLLLDRVGSHKVPKDMQTQLKLAGVEFFYCNKMKPPFFFYTSQVRNHRKITVIDGKIGYMGGFNIGKEYIDMSPKLTPWRDYHLKFAGEGVRDLQHEFLIDWQMATNQNLLPEKTYFPELSPGAVRHQLVPTEGILLEDYFSELIQNAQKTIFIGTPYFIPSSKVFQDLIEAINRGVQVKILIPQKRDHLFVKEASFRYLRPLLKKGAKVYQFVNGFYHAKILIIDEEFCDIGTANFDKRSFFLNLEMNCYIFNQPFLKEVEQVVHKDLGDARLLAVDALDQPSLFIRVKEMIARPISYFL